MFKEFFVSFYRGAEHVVFYKLVKNISEVREFIKERYGKVTDLVIDQVI